MVKVSVIIPVYNVEVYLRKCLDTLINQTLKDIEYICINDGSTDNSLLILEEYAQKDSRFIIINQENQGQGTARNKGLKIVKGEYIGFVDPDDWIESDMYEEMYNKAKKFDVDIIECNRNFYRNNLLEKKEDNQKLILENTNQEIIYENIYHPLTFFENFLDVYSGSVLNKLFKTEFIKKNNILFSKGRMIEDVVFFLSALASNPKYMNIDKYYYCCNLRVGSSVNSISEYGFDIFTGFDILFIFLAKINLYLNYKKYLQKFMIGTSIGSYYRVPAKQRKKFLNLCREYMNANSYKSFINILKSKDSFLEKLFYIKNDTLTGIKYKVINILGLKFKIQV